METLWYIILETTTQVLCTRQSKKAKTHLWSQQRLRWVCIKIRVYLIVANTLPNLRVDEWLQFKRIHRMFIIPSSIMKRRMLLIIDRDQSKVIHRHTSKRKWMLKKPSSYSSSSMNRQLRSMPKQHSFRLSWKGWRSLSNTYLIMCNRRRLEVLRNLQLCIAERDLVIRKLLRISCSPPQLLSLKYRSNHMIWIKESQLSKCWTPRRSL